MLYSIPANERYAKITGKVSGEGTVDGYSIFHNYYLVGENATFVAAANAGYAFMGYYDVTPAVSGGVAKNDYLSSDLSYTFTVASDADLVLEARFVTAGEAEVFFTTYGGTMAGFDVSVVNQVYKKVYDANWKNTKPQPIYNDGGNFIKWYSDSTFKTEATFINGNIKNYYAKVEDSITYTFKDNANTPITATVTNVNPTIYVRNVETIFSAPTLTNYFFVEWRNSTGNPIVKLGQTAKGTQAMVGIFRQRTISFDGLAGATPNAIDTLKITGQAQTLQSVAKAGFTFDGWSFAINGVKYTIASGGQFIADYATLMNNNNIDNLVLMVIWTEKLLVDFIDLAPQTYIYDGGGKAFVIKTGAQTGESGFAVKYFINSAYTATMPTTGGAYNVQIAREETSVYKAYSTEILGGLVIDRQALAKPTLSGVYKYSGVEQTATLNNFNSATMSVAQNSQTNAGTYAIKVALSDATNYKWEGDTATEIAIAWTISQKQLTVAGTTVDTKIYDGNTTAIAHIGAVSGIVDVDKNNNLASVIATAIFENALAGENKTVNI
ncbi:MAG: YDG domain-containing protein, partial [Clostridia bacterium]